MQSDLTRFDLRKNGREGLQILPLVFLRIKKSARTNRCERIFVNENPAIVAGFCKGFADEQKTNKNSAQYVLVPKVPLCKGRLIVEPVYG